MVDPRKVAVDQWSSETVVTRCTFTRDHAAIHLVVLYERHGYLWHAGVEGKDPEDTVDDIRFGNLAGAYDKYVVLCVCVCLTWMGEWYCCILSLYIIYTHLYAVLLSEIPWNKTRVACIFCIHTGLWASGKWHVLRYIIPQESIA